MDNYKARKRFGQNFLKDPIVIDQIIQALAPKGDQNLIEIGPGLGALTVPVLSKTEQLKVIELDRDIIPLLQKNCEPYGALTVINKDALSLDFAQFGKQLRLYGNLPYNISTPLVFHLLEYVDYIQDMLFMFQKEVVNRLCASPGTKAFGKLSVMIQYHCTVTEMINVPPTSFTPQPKVDSAVVHLEPIREKTCVANSIEALELVVTHAFSQRRKTLRNTLKPLVSDDDLEILGIDPGARAETLDVSQFVSIANLVESR